MPKSVIADAGDKCHARPKPGGGDGLIRALAARDDLQIAAQNRLARSGDLKDAHDHVRIGTADDNNMRRKKFLHKAGFTV